MRARFWLQTLAWLVAFLVVFEVLARLVLGHSPRTRIDPAYDRITLADQPVVQSREGFSRGRTNELGHLDAPMPSPLPADGILVIGDSFTEGRQVARDERFTELLGARLGRRVYNVGHTGWSPLNAIKFLRAELPRFAPATVIVQVSGNDLGDVVARGRPHLVERDHVLDIELPDRVKKGMARRITAVREALSRSAFVGDIVVGAFALLKGGDDDGPAPGEEATCADINPLAARAMPWVIGELAAAHRDVRLLYLPQLDYYAGCVDRCTAAKQLFSEAAAARHVTLIDTTAALCAMYARRDQPLNGFWNTRPGTGHFNALGHAVIAEVLARQLAQGGGGGAR